MTGCLTRQAIFDVFEGDGTAEERAHVAACAECRARLQELEAAVAAAASVIRETPLAAMARPRLAVRTIVFPLAAAIALAVGLGHWSGRQSRMLDRSASMTSRVEPSTLTLAEVSKALLADDTIDTRPSPDSDVAYVEAALGGRWPCEGLGMPTDIRCY
jgi:ferric-dicitrate binding protein FerR (iron transport regulator)